MIGFRKAASLLVAGGIGVALFVWKPWQEEKKAVLKVQSKLPTMAVEERDITQRVTLSGSVRPEATALIKPFYDGYVQKLFVKQGDRVKRSQPLVAIAQELSASKPFPIRSPLEGEVVVVKAKTGQTVQKDGRNEDFIMRIDDRSKLYVEADVPELDFVQLVKGQKAIVRPSALTDRTYEGTLVELAGAANYTERWERGKVEFRVKIEIDAPDDQLVSGMTALCDVVTRESRKTLALKHEYIRRDGIKYIVTMADGEQREVKIGVRNEFYTEVVEGVAQGEQVRRIDFLDIAKKR